MDQPELRQLDQARSSTLADLKDTAPELHARLAETLARGLRDAIADRFSDAPADVREAVSAIDFGTSPGADIQSVVIDTLAGRGIQGIDLVDATDRLATLSKVAFASDVPLIANPLLAGDFAKARLQRLIACVGLPDALTDAITGRGLNDTTIDDNMLRGLIELNVLSEGEAHELGAIIGIYRLLDEDPSLTEAMARAGVRRPQQLVQLSADDWIGILRSTTVAELPGGLTLEQRATVLSKRAALAFPIDTILASRSLPGNETLADALAIVASFGLQGAALTKANDLTGEPTAAQEAARQLLRVIDSHPGLRLRELLADESLSVPERVERAGERIGLLSKLVAANPNVELLGLDLSRGSADLEGLAFADIDPVDQPLAIANLKAMQRLLAVVRDPADVAVVAAAGYDSAASIAVGGLDQLVATSGLEPAVAAAYYAEALAALSSISSTVLSIVDVLGGGFEALSVANLSPGIGSYFRTLDGWEDLFGSHDYCRCEHCSSILGPAAYFVDLMQFVDAHVTNKVFTGSSQEHALALKVRRPDLWILPLTCENTDTQIPLLVIVDEILENYIARKAGFTGDLGDRAAVYHAVYRGKLQGAVDALSQPFLLPLERLVAYLAHFARTRADIMIAVGKDADAVAGAALGLSATDRELVVKANVDQKFLRRVFTLDLAFDTAGAVSALDVQDLVAALGVTRMQLGDLLASRFVQAGTSENINIVSERRSADSVQNDVENVRGLRATSLDRLHRFTRLWRAIGWTVRELDLVLTHLGVAGMPAAIDADALRAIVRTAELAKRFKLDVEETIVLYDVLPTTPVRDRRPSLFSRLFNLADFVLLDGIYPKDTTKFVHPALRDDPSTPPPNHAYQRLLAGLRVDADRLLQLIVGLATPLGINPTAPVEADRGFALSVKNLSLLYRHARLSEWLKLSVTDLFRTVAAAPGFSGPYVATMAELGYLLDFSDWLKVAKLPLDDVDYVTRRPVADPSRYRSAKDVIEAMLDRVAADDSLSFAEDIFTFVDGIGDADSRSILAANPSSVVRRVDGRYRLADDFDTAAALTLPAGVTAAEPDLRELLVARHASVVVPTYLSSELRVDVAKARALLALSGANLGRAEIAKALRGDGPPTPLEDIATIVLRLLVLLRGAAFDAAAIEFVQTKRELFGLTDVTTPTLDAMRKLDIYRQLARGSAARGTDLRAALAGFDARSGFAGVDGRVLGRVLGVDVAVVGSLVAHLTLHASAPEALRILRGAADIASYLGVDGATLADIADNSYDRLDAAANAVLAAFRAKYPDEAKWNEQIEPFEARILGRRRDSLVDYLLHSAEPRFGSRAELYRYFLVDVEVDGCIKTSRIVAAANSVQLYVQRVLLNLEQERAGSIHVAPDLIPRDEWAWRKHYRVWEANRKVFLWPENYLLPDLRDDKTPLFEELQKDLLQTELDEQSVLDSYSKYLDGFRDIAGLRIAGSFHDIDESSQRDVLHLFGVTASDPPTYYYRRVENARYGEIADNRGIVWGPWVTMDVRIPVRVVAPVVYNGRLLVFWVEMTTMPQNEVAGGASRFIGYTHKLSLKYASLRLDGRWTPPQRVNLHGPNPFTDSDGTIEDPLPEPEEWPAFETAAKRLAGFGLVSDSETLATLSAAERLALTPRYHDEPHLKIRDGYSLSGFEWQQVYPEVNGPNLLINGAGFQMRASLDLYANTSAETLASPPPARIVTTINGSPPVPVLGLNSGFLMSGSQPVAFFDDYPHAALHADAAKFVQALSEWHPAMRAFVSYGAWTDLVGWAGPTAEYWPINGSLSDGILEVDGDIYLFQSSVRDAGRWLLKRLGTTLGETLSRVLFVSGVDGLLDYDTQKDLSEDPSKILAAVGKVDVRVGSTGIDFTGSYGVYYREIFFHIPLLVAQALNSQGKYAAAQKWYGYIFDPTSSEVIADLPALSDAENAARKRDRNWRYKEFRGLNLPTLRAILTDPKAIEAHKTDPFNPHAIARLRLSGYQKAVVMRYIDNLLDWADELFTQFQRESVNEAMILYATAAEILGDRPAQVGDCGKPATASTYETIGPLLGKGSDFLTEVEHLSVIRNLRGYLGTQRSNGLTVDTARAARARDGALSLPRVRAAGVVSMASAQRIVPRGVDLGAGFTDVSALVRARLRVGNETRIGSSDEQVPFDSLGVTPRPQVPATPDNPSGAIAAAPLDAVAGPDSTGLTRTVRWKALAVSGGESRYQPAADRRVGDVVVRSDEVLPLFGWGLVRQGGPAFCIPQNTNLIDYWDRLEDRLFKLRNCLDITGARRSLPLFAPEIDPMVLVRARAAGLALDDVLDTVSGELPPYRFTYLVDKAKSFAASVQSFGTALLTALEKKDAEELNALRAAQQQEVLALTVEVRQWEYEAAVATLESLQRRRTSIEHRRAYVQGLVDQGLIGAEWTQRISRLFAALLGGTAAGVAFIGSGLHLAPSLGSPFAVKYGGKETGDSATDAAVAVRSLADIADLTATSAAMEATFERRDQGWHRDMQSAEDDLAEIDKQIEGAVLRRRIAERAIRQHATALEQADELYDLYRDRFTSAGLYSWLANETKRLYREAYNATYALARLAERAYRFERNDDATVSLQANYWDASRAGLRAGERLLLDLLRLERRFIETNNRTFEIEQPFSLLQLDAAALVELRQTGRCEFEIPELAFDLAYPGHYRRRIRGVRLTIPATIPPLTNVGATLRILDNRVRRDPRLGEANLDQVPLPRTSAIATSTAQRDGGVFDLNFKDERYLPFEGAGAVSRWALELPASFRPFDYDTIGDVVVWMSYTALEDGRLRAQVEEETGEIEGALLNVLENEPLGRLFSLRQDFPTAYNTLVHSPAATSVNIDVTGKHLPMFLAGRTLVVSAASLIVRTRSEESVGESTMTLNGADQTGFAADPAFGDLPATSVGTALTAGIIRTHKLAIAKPGALAPEAPRPGDPSVLDDTKLTDILLYVETKVS